MENSKLDSKPNVRSGADPLGQLIHAAGRRPAPPAEHYAEIRAASHAAWRANLGARQRRRLSYALAASLAVALVAGALLQSVWRSAPIEVAEIAVMHGSAARFSSASGNWEPLAGTEVIYGGDRIRTDAAGGLALALSNGVSLRVSASSDLELGSINAIELVAGTIYIDSGTGVQTEPTEVHTAYGVVTDIGTQFEVHSSTESLRVRIRSGLVRLTGSELVDDFERGKGKEFEVPMRGAVEERDLAPHDIVWNWTQDLTVPNPNMKTLGEYLGWISMETGITIGFDSTLTERRINREEFIGDSEGLLPLEILNLIEATTSFRFERQDGFLEVQGL